MRLIEPFAVLSLSRTDVKFLKNEIVLSFWVTKRVHLSDTLFWAKVATNRKMCSLYEKVVKNKRHLVTLPHNYPGQYYCGPCNVSLNSESQFGQHQVLDAFFLF